MADWNNSKTRCREGVKKLLWVPSLF